MPTILDLPRETIELIYKHLITTPTQWLHVTYPNALASSTAACLRLVCRQWAEWLYEHHLYRGLKFSSADRTEAFVRHIYGRPPSLPRARCQHLVIDRIWAVHPPPNAGQQDMMDSEILQYLIDLFSDTIITLDLQFVDYPSLYLEDMAAIGRIENLRDLHIDISSTPSGDQLWPSTHPEIFNDLMVATQGVNSLVLDIQLALPEVPEPGLWKDKRYPAITHLGLNMIVQQPTHMLRLVMAFKSSLKALSIIANGSGPPEETSVFYAAHGLDYDAIADQQIISLGLEPFRLRRVYEYMKETLEGLNVSSSHILSDSLDLKFTKLRVFAVGFWANSITNYLSRDIFTQAPIEVLAIDAQSAFEDCEAKFVGNPLANLPQLKKLVFMEARSDYSAPQKFLDACDALGVKVVYIDHCQLPRSEERRVGKECQP